jgi:hypothetical protein
MTTFFNYSYSKNYVAGFPLDDAWIFFGYAKTFSTTGFFSINPNTSPSAGITSPLYLLILSISFILGLKSEFLFVLVFNSLLLFLISIILFKILLKLFDNFWLSSFLTIIFILDYRTISIANSGMETILFVFIEILIIYSILEDYRKLTLILLGIGFWVRPEIIILLPIYFILFYRRIKIKEIICFLTPFTLYFIFMKVFTGVFIPQTGKAKSVFFSYINKFDFLKASGIYLLKLGFPLLFLFFLSSIILIIKNKNHFLNLLLLYVFSFYAFYVFYLPILYNFGRYLFPLFPFIIILSAYSIDMIIKKYNFLIFIIILIITIFTISNFQKGRLKYAYKVHQFTARHIIISNWINNNTSKNSIIATHDIGAIGYLTQRPIIDLVGLINKRVIGLSNRPEKLKKFLVKYKAKYIAVLNSWFVVINSPLLFQTPRKSDIKFQIYKFTNKTEVIRVDLFYNKQDYQK